MDYNINFPHLHIYLQHVIKSISIGSVAEERVHDIDPDIKVTTYKTFFGPETQDSFDFSQFDYVVDAIDSVTKR